MEKEKKETPSEEPIKEEPEEEDATGNEVPPEAEKKEEPSKIDYDAEIAKEKAKKPDPDKARDAFKLREQKRIEREKELDSEDEDKPLTQKDLDNLRSEWRSEFQREALRDRFEVLAKNLAGSDKEAELMVARWENRIFPSDMTVTEQVEEVYASINAKRLIAERNEALRALRGHSGVETNSAATHRDATKGTEPQLSPQDAKAIKDAGFTWNGTSRRYEKKLPNGALLVRDSKTGITQIVKK